MTTRQHWREAGAADLSAIVALHEAAAAVDGGSPFAAAQWLLRRWYLDGVEASLAAFRDDALIGICARRPGGQPDGIPARIAGLVAPAHRGQGLGARLLDFGLAAGQPDARVLVETELLTAAADALYCSRGLRQVFAEDVMVRSLAEGAPVVPPIPLSRSSPGLRRPRRGSSPSGKRRSGSARGSPAGRPPPGSAG